MSLRTRITKLEHRATVCRTCGTPLCCSKCQAPDDIPDYSARLLKRLEAHLAGAREKEPTHESQNEKTP
jgi:hypothetical protein